MHLNVFAPLANVTGSSGTGFQARISSPPTVSIVSQNILVRLLSVRNTTGSLLQIILFQVSVTSGGASAIPGGITNVPNGGTVTFSSVDIFGGLNSIPSGSKITFDMVVAGLQNAPAFINVSDLVQGILTSNVPVITAQPQIGTGNTQITIEWTIGSSAPSLTGWIIGGQLLFS